MRHLISIILLFTLTNTQGHEVPDTLLGEGFSSETFEMGRDYSGEVRATLVRTLPIERGRDAILYIHGFNDYFFQSEMAHRFQDSGYNFYAIDLRRYGRSLAATDRPFEVRDLKEYFEEIDLAIDRVRKEGAKRLILMGHSTGGLIASYFAGIHQENPPIDGLILNSPYLEQNVNWALREIALPAISFIGKYYPNIEVLKDESTLYFESLHTEGHGEWTYDPSLKMRFSPPITAGWLRAVNKAQQSVQGGYSLSIPILLMYSDKSIYTDHWCDDMQRGDAVLNVEDIAKYGAKLGSKVTPAEIKDGMHDLILSRPEARERAYHSIFEWLKSEF